MLAVTVPTALLPRTRAFQSRSVATSSTFGNLPPLGGMLHCLECIETPILPVLAAVPPEGHREEAGMAAKDSIDVRFPLAPARKHNSNNIWYRRWRKTGCPRRIPGVTRPNRGRRSQRGDAAERPPLRRDAADAPSAEWDQDFKDFKG